MSLSINIKINGSPVPIRDNIIDFIISFIVRSLYVLLCCAWTKIKSSLPIPNNKILLDDSRVTCCSTDPDSQYKHKHSDKITRFLKSAYVASGGILLAQFVNKNIMDTMLRAFFIKRILLSASTGIILINKDCLLLNQYVPLKKVLKNLSIFFGFNPKVDNIHNYLYLLISKNLLNFSISVTNKMFSLPDIAEEAPESSFLEHMFLDGEIASHIKKSFCSDCWDMVFDNITYKLLCCEEQSDGTAPTNTLTNSTVTAVAVSIVAMFLKKTTI